MYSIYRGGVFLTSCSDDDNGGGGDGTVSVTGVTLSQESASVTVGSEITLTATVKPENATNKEVEWTSSDSSIATVDGGKVTAKKTGNATIQVKTKDGSKTDTCEVTVKAKAGTVTLGSGDSAVTITVDENGMATLADGTKITVEESDDGVATYTVNGGSTYTVTTTTDAEGTQTTTAKEKTASGQEKDVGVVKTVTYTVTFSTDGGSTVDAQTIESGNTATEPAAPTKEGYTFAGWYSDLELTSEYDFTAAVTADITLYAKWTANATPTPTPTPDPDVDENATVYKAEDITEAEVIAMKDASGNAPEAGKSTKLAAGTYAIWAGKGAIVTGAEKMSVQINTGKTVPVAIVSATNMSGVTATAVPVVGANISTIGGPLTNYVRVDTPQAGATKIDLNITIDAVTDSTKTMAPFEGASFWILATDLEGKILAVLDIGDIYKDNIDSKYGSMNASNKWEGTAVDVSLGTATLGEKVAIGFARGRGSGGLKIHSITLTPAAPAKTEQAAPTAANFTAEAPTSSGGNGTVTINGITDVTTLEYAASADADAADWTTVAASPVSLASGTYYFRFKETDTKLASPASPAVTVSVYVDPGKGSQTTPNKDAFTTTATTASGNDGTITIPSAITPTTVEYKLATETTWKAASTATISALAAGTYDIRLAATDTLNASDAVQVVVKAFTAAPSLDDFTVTKASAENAADGKIKAKSATAIANLEVLTGTDTWTKWEDLGSGEGLTLSEDKLELSGLSAGDYTARYAETATTAKSANGTITVGYVKTFTSFDVTSTGVTANEGSNDKTYTAEDGSWSVSGAKIQFTDSKSDSVGIETYDYDANAGTGYKYTGRVNVKSGKFTIKTTSGTIFRIDGGSGSNGSARDFTFTGAEEAKWSPSSTGTFYFTANAATVEIAIGSNACNIYGIHVVDSKAETKELSSTTTYSKPTLELSASSVAKGGEVTISATIPKSKTEKTYSDGTKETTEADVTETITYKVATVTDGNAGDYADATVTDGKVSTSEQGTFSYTASYTIEETTYTSDAVTLEVTKSFEAETKYVSLAAATIGGKDAQVVDLNLDSITGIEALSSEYLTAEYTAANGDTPAYITLTSKKGSSGEAVTVTVNGTKDSASVTAALLVVVSAGGEMTVTAKAYSAAPNSVTVKLFTSPAEGETATYSATPVISAEGLVSKKADATWAYNSTIGAIKSDCPKWGTSTNVSGGYIEPNSSVTYTPQKDEDVGYVTFTLKAEVACKVTKVSVKSGNGQTNDAYLAVFLGDKNVAQANYSSKVATITDAEISKDNTFAKDADIVVKVGMVSSKTQSSTKSGWAKIAISDLVLTVEKQ